MPLQANRPLPYGQPFFDLQLVFARKMADLSHLPFEQMLLHFTALYRIFGLGGSLDPTHALWQNYLQELQRAAEPAEGTYHWYLQRYPAIPQFTDAEHWGCFAYEYTPEQHAIHLHFSNQDPSGPLRHDRMEIRIAELRAMFQQIKRRHPVAAVVQGGSWLYNLEAYRRLFPPAFSQSAQPETRFTVTGRNIWGQFLRHTGDLRAETQSVFLARVGHLHRMEDYPACFPYPNMRAEASIHLFYPFYALD